ncbi:MAG: hypothetical protein ACON35_08540 [Candidatus Marinamargulisbacteria bacterium]
MPHSISFFSSLRTISSYMPPIRCCFKQRKSDILFHVYHKLVIQKPQDFNHQVAATIKSITYRPYTPYSSSEIVPLNYMMSKHIITIINNIRLILSKCPAYAPKCVDLYLSPKEEAFLNQGLLSKFPKKIDLEHQPYIDALNALARNNAWHLCFLEGDSLLTAITSFFESKDLLNLKT